MSFDGQHDIKGSCKECNKPFVFHKKEQLFFLSNNLSNIPKKCKACRAFRQKQASKRPKTIPKSDVKRVSNRRARLLPGLVELVRQNVFISVEGKEHVIPAGPLTTHLQPGMVVGVSLSLAGKISNIDPIPQYSGALPALQGFVRNTNIQTRTITLKIRSRLDTFDVKVPAEHALPTIHSTIMFEPVFLEGKFECSKLLASVRPSPPGRPAEEVLSPTAASLLGVPLKVDADLSSTSRLSPLMAPESFLDFTSSSFLDTEEDILTTPELLNADNKDTLPNILAKGFSPLLLVNETSAGKLVPALRSWCREVEAAGLRRTMKVLYPVRKDTTPQNLPNTFATKLMDQKEFPFLTHIQILAQPVEILLVDDRGNPLGTRLQYVAALTYEVTPSPPPLQIATLQNAAAGPVEQMSFDPPSMPKSSTLLLLVPRSDARHAALATPTACCTPVGHAMSRSHSALALTFPEESGAQLFLESNSASASPLLAGPAANMFSDTGGEILTIITSKDVDTKALFSSLNLAWLFAVAHTKFRFMTKLGEDELVEKIKEMNSWSPNILSLTNDHGKTFDLQCIEDEKESEMEVAPLPAAPMLAIRISNVHATQLDLVQPFLKTIWPDAPQPRLTPDGLDTLHAEFIAPTQDIADLFSGKAASVGGHSWFFQCVQASPHPADEALEQQQLEALAKILIHGLGEE